jgi:hypothetical protein
VADHSVIVNHKDGRHGGLHSFHSAIVKARPDRADKLHAEMSQSQLSPPIGGRFKWRANSAIDAHLTLISGTESTIFHIILYVIDRGGQSAATLCAV